MSMPVEEDKSLTQSRQSRIFAIKSRQSAHVVNKPPGESARAIRRQVTMVVLANAGVMSIGMGLGLPTTTQAPLTNTSVEPHLTEEEYSWFASLNLLVAPLGGLLSGILLDRLGRKNSMYLLNMLALISWILMASASPKNRDMFFIQLLASRFVMGINLGLASAPTGVYSAEISTPKIRGCLILGTSIAVAAGITFIYILGYFIRDDWRKISLICSAFQLVTLFCIVPLPESQNWLILKGRINEARRSLNYFRGIGYKNDAAAHPAVQAEFNLLQKHIQTTSGIHQPTLIRSLRYPEVYKPFLILFGLFSFQQLTGIVVVIVYAVQISYEAGVTIDPFLCAVLIGFARLVTTCPMGIILEKWGRRPAGLVSAFGMGVSMLLLAFNEKPYLRDIPYLPAIAMISFILISTIGLYTLPYFMISELFPQYVRGPASGLTVAFATLVSFLCTKLYPTMKQGLGREYCFLIYAIFSFIALVFIYFCLPETRGKTLIEIEESFQRGRKKRTIPEAIEMVAA